MKQRTLGTQGLRTSTLGTAMSEFYGASNESEAIAAIHRALDLGILTNEKLVGEAVRGTVNR